MSGNVGVSVMGMVKDMPGQKKALNEFVSHNKRVGDALMNLEDGMDEDDPRPAIGYVPYPKMLFHATHGEIIVANKEEQKAREGEGYRTTPYEKPRVVVLDPAVEKKALVDENRELKGQITMLTDLMSKMEQRLDSIDKKGK